ncbi:hypothetical protein PIB30_002602 [Stylosanthes scabra]|uniref:Disease resistance RPP13-like protein 1 n=1 Tax=Stylosanthes scabra TaxID=79078 RepID=A0ABU6Z2W2_9FABA|nr:hypothetical protein [Stylosanthes scabra]
MAGVLVGGAFLSGFINTVLDRLISADAVNFVVGKKLSSDLVERLKNSLMDAGALVDDAEIKQLDHQPVKEWLDSLRDAIYTADDLLDRVCTKAATQKGVFTFLPSFLNSEERHMVNEIERVVRRIEDLEKRKAKLGLQKISTASFSWKTPSTSLVRGNVFGREDDKKALVNMLNDNNEHHLSVISIVGMGRVGKTTLAQWMFNNPKLMEGFDLKAWACISENFNIVETTKNIVKEISANTQDLDRFNSIQDALKKGLSEKKFFVVLDDVWTNASFPESNGSPTLEGIGKRIAKKCDGLLLAVETLGCLCRRHDAKEWEKILRSDIWGFSTNDTKYIFKRFVMHDLLHDLAIFLAGDFYCRREELGEQKGKKVLTRHLSHLQHGSLDHADSNIFNSIVKLESLRTSLYNDDLLSMERIASKFKHLRVLSFRKLDVLPDSIGELIHLRYLNLSWTHINRLPESLCNLHNLQTLILHECTRLTMLPSGMHNLENLQHLDLRKTSLEEMPGKMRKLEQLHILSFFIVGKREDNGICELGGLSNLHGSLEIKKLENIVDVCEAKNARIMDKTHIDELCLEWCSGDDMVSNTQTERDILRSLQPHIGLKELNIKRYKGTIFSDWLGNCSYNNMTSLALESCKNCCMLPSLGQLPSLKSLCIQGFDQLACIGDEFYKNEYDHSLQIAPFPSLESLEFHDMPCWEEWYLPDSEAFPQLKRLQITNCPMLKGDVVNHVLMRIISSSSNVSNVRKIVIGEVQEGQPKDMSLNLDRLSITGCEDVVESTFTAMININHLAWLQEIQISGCSSAVSLKDSSLLPKSLQKLTIFSCMKLEFLHQHQHKYGLVELKIEDSCESLTSLSLDAFPNLKTLKICGCYNLESVSMSKPPHTALQRLTINGCHKFVSFPEGGLAAPNLLYFGVMYCSKLEALPCHMNSLLPNLQHLHIQHCPNICRLPEGGLPPNLKELSVGRQWRDLSSMGKGNLESLTHLTICGFRCESKMKSFPEIGSLPHLPSLNTLEITWFDNLETLECSQLLSLTSLQQLVIKNCEKLKNMAGEKLPSSLLQLEILFCRLLREHCKNKHQQIWPKIEHIPTILVNGQQIV